MPGRWRGNWWCNAPAGLQTDCAIVSAFLWLEVSTTSHGTTIDIGPVVAREIV